MSQSVVIALIVLAAILVIAAVGDLARHVGKPRLRPLPDESRDRFARSWRAIEARFKDDPRNAVQEADKTAVMILAERGANVSDPRQMPDELRKAGEAMRPAMTHYKRIVDDAVGNSRPAPETRRREIAS